MNQTIENKHYQFSIDKNDACWSLSSRADNALSLQNIRLGIAYRCQGKRFSELNRWAVYQLSETEAKPLLHGSSQQYSLFIGPDPNGLRYELDFALLDEYPLFLGKITIRNEGPNPVYVDRLSLCNSNIDSSPTLKSQRAFHDKRSFAFLSNGWQSWSYTGLYTPYDRFQ